MAKTKLCKYCRSEIDKKASVCPYCQKKQSGLGDAFKAVIVAIALIIFVPAIIGACNKSSSKTKSPSEADVEVLTTAEKQVSVGTTAAESSESETTVSETDAETVTEEDVTEAPVSESIVVYDKDGIKISYTGLEEKPSKYLFKFLIENDTDADRIITDDDLSVNGFMISGGMFSSVAAHKKINDDIRIYKNRLEENNITDIENIEFIFRIYEDENYNNYIDTDIISLNIK